MRPAVAVTFDNLGEAADLERGQWPRGESVGRHLSVVRALPRILELLGELELRATFFIEGINAELYPEALREIDAAGHEVAYHGWRHEVWSDLDAGRERDLLHRGVSALTQIGLRPVGFRPPGGRLAPSSANALAQAGFRYCSPAGDGAGVLGQLAVLPFRWVLIDAFHYLPSFAGRRRAVLGSADTLPPAALSAALGAALRRATSDRAFLALLFHPFLADTADRLQAMRTVLTDIGTHDVWCAPLREIATSVHRRPDWRLHLDES